MGKIVSARRLSRVVSACALGACALATTAALEARITKLEIAGVESPANNGQSFGAAGQYERVFGRAYGELNPNDPHNEIITDLKLAPRNAKGMVEYNMTFSIQKPIDMSKTNGVLVLLGREPRQRHRRGERGRPGIDRLGMAGRRHADGAQTRRCSCRSRRTPTARASRVPSRRGG